MVGEVAGYLTYQSKVRYYLIDQEMENNRAGKPDLNVSSEPESLEKVPSYLAPKRAPTLGHPGAGDLCKPRGSEPRRRRQSTIPDKGNDAASTPSPTSTLPPRPHSHWASTSERHLSRWRLKEAT